MLKQYGQVVFLINLFKMPNGTMNSKTWVANYNFAPRTEGSMRLCENSFSRNKI